MPCLFGLALHRPRGASWSLGNACSYIRADTRARALAALTDLALWKSPQQSGAVLGGATAVFYVFKYLQYTVLALVAHLLLATVVGFFLWTSFCRFKNR